MFTKEEENKIGLIMNLCMQDESLKKSLEDKYDNNPSVLNPYEIYVLEVVFRYGNNGYFDELSKMGSISDTALKIKTFIGNCNNIEDYELEKVKDYYEKAERLNDIEKFCIKLILKNSEKKRILNNKMMYTYDDYVEIKLDTENHIKDAIKHILFIKVIATYMQNRIDEDSRNGIIKRQLKPGLFASSDKYYISTMLRDIPEVGEAILATTEKCFDDVKTDIENGNGLSLLSNQFGEGIEDVKINISFDDVYGYLTKDKNKSI